MKTYLVTGGAGFIGANYVKYIRKHQPDIRIIVLDLLTYAGYYGTIAEDIDDQQCIFIKGNICDLSLLENIFQTYHIDVVVNFAAESHVDRSIENPQLFLQTNILGTQSLLEVARKNWTIGTDEQGYPTYRSNTRFHQVSTDEVYGSLGAEGFFTEQTPLDPHSPYSASKASADHIVKAYYDTFHLPISITRCSNNYGPYQFPEKLIPLILNNILAGKSLPVYGKGENIRDWLYVEDHCKAIQLVIQNGKVGEVYNVGGHNERKNITIVQTILHTLRNLFTSQPALKQHLKKQIKDNQGNISIDWINEDLITFVKDRLGHDQRYGIDPTKMKKELNWKPETTFEEGIIKTILWYLQNTQWTETVSGEEYQTYYERMYKNK